MTRERIGTIGSAQFFPPLVLLGLVAVLIALYGTTLYGLAGVWSSDPDYSHGYLVPAFAVLLLWLRREMFAAFPVRPDGWALGLAFLGVGTFLRLGGEYFYYNWFGPASFLLCLAGVVLAVGGWPVWRWSWPAIVFLVFMMPLPGRLETVLALPLQRIATLASTYVLQTIGLPALAEGNVIVLNEVKIGVVEACSGLRMLVVFTAVATAVALLIQRPRWEKLLILFSAIPTALVCNIVRITATGILHETAGSRVANAVFHDLAGWLMMPLAIGLLWSELILVSFVLEPVPVGPVSVTLPPQPLE